MKREGQLGVPIDPGEVSNVFTLFLPESAAIKSASFQSDNGDYILIIHYVANEDNSNTTFKKFSFKTMRYMSSMEVAPKDHQFVHLCSVHEGLYTYEVFYTP